MIELKTSRPVGVFVTALGSSLQGLDKLPAEDRSSSAVLELLDHVLREMDSSELTRVSQNEKGALKAFRAHLQDVIEGDNFWGQEFSPSDLIH